MNAWLQSTRGHVFYFSAPEFQIIITTIFGFLQAQGSMVKPDCLKLKQAADFPSLANGFVSLPPSANQVSSSLGGGSPKGHDLYSAVYQHQEPSPGP